MKNRKLFDTSSEREIKRTKWKVKISLSLSLSLSLFQIFFPNANIGWEEAYL